MNLGGLPAIALILVAAWLGVCVFAFADRVVDRMGRRLHRLLPSGGRTSCFLLSLDVRPSSTPRRS